MTVVALFILLPLVLVVAHLEEILIGAALVVVLPPLMVWERVTKGRWPL